MVLLSFTLAYTVHGQALLAVRLPYTRLNQPRPRPWPKPSHEPASSMEEEKRHAGSAVPKADAGI
jgi:hypothetical protein